MRPLFSIHAGEYLVGEVIERKVAKQCGFPLSIWVPVKDQGIDLLVTNNNTGRAVKLQVKFSKDFVITNPRRRDTWSDVCGGWWVHNIEKIRKSRADFWIFVIHTYLGPFDTNAGSVINARSSGNARYLILRPSELERRIAAIHGEMQGAQGYFTVMRNGNTDRCIETRNLKTERQKVADGGAPENKERDFTAFLDNWSELVSELKQP